jgi:hypothetical protein
MLSESPAADYHYASALKDLRMPADHGQRAKCCRFDPGKGPGDHVYLKAGAVCYKLMS